MPTTPSFCHLPYPLPLPLHAHTQLHEPVPAGALEGVSVVMGGTSESCDTACTKVGKQCSQKHLAVLDNCDRLREQVGGCLSMGGAWSRSRV